SNGVSYANSTPMALREPVLDDRSAELMMAFARGIGPRLRKSLLAHFGSAQAVMSAAASDLCAVEGIGPKLSRSIALARAETDIESELADCQRSGVEVLVESQAGYPDPLRTIHDPP